MILSESWFLAAAPALAAAGMMVGLRFRDDSEPALRDLILRRGRMPKTVRQAIEREGVRHLEEDLRIGVTRHDSFDLSPSRGGQFQFLPGAVAVTPRRLVAHLRSRRVLNLPLDSRKCPRFAVRREGANGICLLVDAAALNDRSRGTLEYRFRSASAERLTAMLLETLDDPADRWRQCETTAEFV
ncbi:MAG: hypothetical protein ACLFRG_07230 [Desulfococcaceae bacterium]